MAQQPELDAWGMGHRVEEEIHYLLLVLPPTHVGRSVCMHTHGINYKGELFDFSKYESHKGSIQQYHEIQIPTLILKTL